MFAPIHFLFFNCHCLMLWFCLDGGLPSYKYPTAILSPYSKDSLRFLQRLKVSNPMSLTKEENCARASDQDGVAYTYEELAEYYKGAWP